jgi:uncharacterized membrane protein
MTPMLAYLLDWFSLLGRWMHLIFGIAWIGASFYFVWLDNHLLAPEDPALDEKGVGGELWAVHGGGFYNAQKYRIAPATLPAHLHWFYWEAYSTWLSGFFLLCVIYYARPEIYLIDPSVAALGPVEAVAIGIGTLVAGWIIYDRLCESPLARSAAGLSSGLFVLVCAAAFGLCHVFSGRGAFLHFGAMLGTLMVANVFFVIIPAQRQLVAAKIAGTPPDPVYAQRAKQRSVHNTYFTLPVLFTMISNHYAMTTGASYNWLVLIAMTLAGAAIRIYFVDRHKAGSRASPFPLVGGLATLAFLALLMRPATSIPSEHSANASLENPNAPSAALKAPHQIGTEMLDVVERRCAVCHAATPTQPGFTAPPNGVMLDSLDRIVAQRDKMRVQLATHAMPIGNLTQLTEDERQALIAWIDAGTPH